MTQPMQNSPTYFEPKQNIVYVETALVETVYCGD